MHPDVPGGLVHAVRGVSRGRGSGVEEFVRVRVSAVCAVYVCGAGVWVGEFAVGVFGDWVGRASACGVVVFWGEDEGEE